MIWNRTGTSPISQSLLMAVLPGHCSTPITAKLANMAQLGTAAATPIVAMQMAGSRKPYPSTTTLEKRSCCVLKSLQIQPSPGAASPSAICTSLNKTPQLSGKPMVSFKLAGSYPNSGGSISFKKVVGAPIPKSSPSPSMPLIKGNGQSKSAVMVVSSSSPPSPPSSPNLPLIGLTSASKSGGLQSSHHHSIPDLSLSQNFWYQTFTRYYPPADLHISLRTRSFDHPLALPKQIVPEETVLL